MRIGIIGKGFVGTAIGEVLSKEHEIHYYDPFKGLNNRDKLKSCDFIFICVPTDMLQDGSINLQEVHSTLRTLKIIDYNSIIIMKSSVVPGTCDKLEKEYEMKICSNPEFLREKYAIEDMKNPTRIVIGKYNEVSEIYATLFPIKKFQYIFCSNKEAEMIKYASNVLLAGQIGLANEIYKICQNLSIDYNNVKNGVLPDSRIARNIDVPGPDGLLGFGGHCFPKDLNALIYLAKSIGYHSYLLEEVWRSNKHEKPEKYENNGKHIINEL